MPPVKTPAIRKAASRTEMSAATRRQLERAAKRLEKSLEESQAALQALGQDLGHGGRAQYKLLGEAARDMRQEATKPHKQLMKDLEKLAAAVSTVAAKKPAATRKTAATR